MEISVKDYARECAERGLRGDYSRCRADFTVRQAYDYSDEAQEVWRLLCDRQTKLTERLAHRLVERERMLQPSNNRQLIVGHSSAALLLAWLSGLCLGAVLLLILLELIARPA